MRWTSRRHRLQRAWWTNRCARMPSRTPPRTLRTQQAPACRALCRLGRRPMASSASRRARQGSASQTSMPTPRPFSPACAMRLRGVQEPSCCPSSALRATPVPTCSSTGLCSAPPKPLSRVFSMRPLMYPCSSRWACPLRSGARSTTARQPAAAGSCWGSPPRRACPIMASSTLVHPRAQARRPPYRRGRRTAGTARVAHRLPLRR